MSVKQWNTLVAFWEHRVFVHARHVGVLLSVVAMVLGIASVAHPDWYHVTGEERFCVCVCVCVCVCARACWIREVGVFVWRTQDLTKGVTLYAGSACAVLGLVWLGSCTWRCRTQRCIFYPVFSQAVFCRMSRRVGCAWRINFASAKNEQWADVGWREKGTGVQVRQN